MDFRGFTGKLRLLGGKIRKLRVLGIHGVNEKELSSTFLIVLFVNRREHSKFSKASISEWKMKKKKK